MNLYQKLIEVRKHIPYLQKDSSGPKYKYVGSSQVLSAVRGKLDELNILLKPEVIGHNVRTETVENKNQDGKNKKTTTYFTELDMKMTWIDTEDPETKLECSWYGQGVDIAGEKGVGKALTYAEKYFMLKFFNIATDNDDPDSFQGKNSQDDPGESSRGKSPKKKETVMPFGKHKGEKLSAIPEDYLHWVVDNAEQKWVKEAAQKEIISRNKKAKKPSSKPSSEEEPSARQHEIKEIIDGNQGLYNEVINYLKSQSEDKGKKTEIDDLSEDEYQDLINFLVNLKTPEGQDVEIDPKALDDYYANEKAPWES